MSQTLWDVEKRDEEEEKKNKQNLIQFSLSIDFYHHRKHFSTWTGAGDKIKKISSSKKK
jgi:hypothetical protein